MKQITRTEASVLYAYGVTIGLGARKKGARRPDIKSVSKLTSRAENLDEAIQHIQFVRAVQKKRPIIVTEFYVY